MKIVESIYGTYFYHLSDSGKTGRSALCGNINVMSTEVPMSSWNTKPGHLHEKYCEKCDKIFKEN